MNLSGKTAVVLGGSGDIGRGIALRLAQLGADIALTGRTPNKLEATVSLIREQTGRIAKAFPHDLRNDGESGAFIEEAVNAFGGIDIVVTCAGDFKRGHITDISQNEWKNGFDLMFIGAVSAVTAAWPHLQKRKGRVVMISGMHGIEPHAESIVSGPICAAILNFAKAASHDAKRQGISINCIIPGWIEGRRLESRLDMLVRDEGIPREKAQQIFAERVGLVRFGTPADVANVVELLVTDKGSYIQGAAIVLDGGQTHTM
jgi:NAD(P)-dependent dehydrogenase (short-subunit alcohol dehydrogenase family)